MFGLLSIELFNGFLVRIFGFLEKFPECYHWQSSAAKIFRAYPSCILLNLFGNLLKSLGEKLSIHFVFSILSGNCCFVYRLNITVTVAFWLFFKTFVKSNDKYMSHNNQDFDLFQIQFLIGLYECSSRNCARPTRY